jgi:hypothetical protein
VIGLLKYYKVIENNYITAIGINIGGVEIDRSEYDDLLNIIRNKPVALDGFDYRLNTNLEWDKCEEKGEEYES